MGSRLDRISNLPDPILQSILSLVPLKSAIRTSVLSKRWTHLWLHCLVSATKLDFGDDLSRNQPPETFVATVNRYLHLHGRHNDLHELRILFNPPQPFHLDYLQWIAFVASKRVKVLDLSFAEKIKHGHAGYNRDRFRLPISLYACEHLTHLSLTRCNLYKPRKFSGLSRLQSLSLSHVYITDKMLVTLLSVCHRLESLSITSCEHLVETRLTAPNLRRLVLGDCWGGYKLWLSAPNLESFHYYGHIYFHNYFIDVSSLVDAFVCLIGRRCEVDWMERVADLFRAKILTICTSILMTVATSEKRWAHHLPAIRLENLRELQILMDRMDYPHLSCIYYFLWRSTFISKLFIRLPGNYEADYDEEYDFWINESHLIQKPPPGVIFEHLKAIKLSNFRGDRVEMKLVQFLLGKAIVLETLLLVAPPRNVRGKKWRDLSVLREEVALLPKASTDARIILCGFLDYDGSLHPMHSEYYYDPC